MRKTLLITALFAAALTAAADSQKVTMTTSRPVGQPMTLLVNATRSGVTVDWGDGTPVSYKPEKPGGVLEIQGTVKGATIVLACEKGLNTLSAEDCDLTAIKLTEAPAMQSLYLQHNLLESIDISAMAELRDLNIADNLLKAITLSTTKQPKIETLDLSGNAITATSFSYATTNLRYLNLADNNYKTLTISKAANLDALIVGGNQLSSLGLPGNISLLDARNNKVSKMTVPPAGQPLLQQCLLDDNAMETLDLSASTDLNTLTIARNGARSVVLPTKAKLQVYDCSDNALSFGSFPAKTNLPSVYFAYAPQGELDLTANGLREGNWTSHYMPWIVMNPDYSTRSNAEYQLDLTPHKDGSATNSVNIEVYSVEDGAERLLQKATAAEKTLDYSYATGKMTFLKEYDRVFLQMTDAAYPDLVIRSNPFMVIDVTKEGILNVYDNDDDNDNSAFDLQGRRVENATQGLYIMGGKKVLVK